MSNAELTGWKDAKPGNVYREHGYRSRIDYLQNLAQDFDIDIRTVLALAELIGEDEDFDGLVVALEDML